MHATTDLTFLKLGGELLEPGAGLDAMLAAIAALAGRGPLAIVHGGGREIDAETARRGVPKQAVDGLRITDAATLEAVVAVLAGTVNTRLVVGAGVARRARGRPDRRRRARRPVHDRAAAPHRRRPLGRSRPRRPARVASGRRR